MATQAKSKAIIRQLLTEFISDNSLKKSFLLKSGNEGNVLKKYEDEEKEIYGKEYKLSICYGFKKLCYITKIRILNNSFSYYAQQ